MKTCLLFQSDEQHETYKNALWVWLLEQIRALQSQADPATLSPFQDKQDYDLKVRSVQRFKLGQLVYIDNHSNTFLSTSIAEKLAMTSYNTQAPRTFESFRVHEVQLIKLNIDEHGIHKRSEKVKKH